MWSYTFLMAQNGRIPSNRYGGAVEVRYRLSRNDGAIPPTIQVGERFIVKTDPYSVFRHFRAGPEQARNGFFNDSYRLVSPDPLPQDFRLEVEQIYLINNMDINGKNKIVYTDVSVLLYGWVNNSWRLWSRGSSQH